MYLILITLDLLWCYYAPFFLCIIVIIRVPLQGAFR